MRFRVTADLDGVTICNCSICTKKGSFLGPDRAARAVRAPQGEDDLATYEFNTKVAKHHFCRACGIHPFTCRAPIRTRSTSTEAPGFAFRGALDADRLRKPARMDDLLEHVAEPQEVKARSVVLQRRVTRAAEALVEASVRLAFI